jgi:protein subunit release factor A
MAEHTIAIDVNLYSSFMDAVGRLATNADQAATLLSEEFDSLVRPSIDEVRRLTEQMPATKPEEWDGTLREHDLKISVYRVPYQNSTDDPKGVKILHEPTGIGRQSDSKGSQLANREVAMNALTEAVRKEYARRERARGA